MVLAGCGAPAVARHLQLQVLPLLYKKLSNRTCVRQGLSLMSTDVMRSGL